MCECIHTGSGGQRSGHGAHHIGIHKRNDGDIVGIYTNHLAILVFIGDHIVDGDLGSSAGCGGDSQNGYAGIFGGSNAFKTAYILEFGIGDDNADGFGGIHRGAAAYSNDIICIGSTECCNTVLYIPNRRIGLDVGIHCISKLILIQQIRNFSGYTKTDQIGI